VRLRNKIPTKYSNAMGTAMKDLNDAHEAGKAELQIQ
jgi:hypothetical protein